MIYIGQKRKAGNWYKTRGKYEERKQANKIERLKRPVCFLKEKGEKEREGKRNTPAISGAITRGNGSHLSHLDIWEDLWLHRREGQAEVSVERVLHRGLWHGSDDTPSLQQWEVKGKNERALGERGQCGTAGLTRIQSFLNTLSLPCSHRLLTPPPPRSTYGTQCHRYTHTLQGGRENRVASS